VTEVPRLGRRAFFVGAAAVIISPARVARAQRPGTVPRVGALFPLSLTDMGVPATVQALERGLRDLGYVPGKDIVVEYRWGHARAERLPELAAELVRLKVDVLVSVATQASLAAKASTTTIPIVMVYVGDPVGIGMVSSLARPGGNITGLGANAEEYAAKYPELLKQAVPRASRVAVLLDPVNPSYGVYWRAFRPTAQALGIQFFSHDVRTPEELPGAFAAMVRQGADALIAPIQPFTFRHQQRIIDLAAKHRLPAIYGTKEAVEAGGLMSYGVNQPDVFRQAATYVVKILKGAKPADLPVEQPSKFELVINLRTAKALGLTIPESLRSRLDEVIQ